MNQYRVTVLFAAESETLAEDAAAAALDAVKSAEGVRLGRSALEVEETKWALLAEPAMTAGELRCMRVGDGDG